MTEERLGEIIRFAETDSRHEDASPAEAALLREMARIARAMQELQK